MEIYQMWIVAFFLTLILTIIFTVLFSKIKGNLFENIRGGIPRGVGIAPFLVMVLFFPEPYNYLIAIIGIMAFIDDLIGRKRLGSYMEIGQFFRGIGILVVMIYGYLIMGPVAILVALMVQILNIADMQPGTACFTVIIMSVVSFTILTLFHSSSYYIPILLLLICLGYISQDYSGYIMMGEIGNHSFGVALGICFALVSATITKTIAPTVFYPVEFIIMLILFLITAIIIAKLREETLRYYLTYYLHIDTPTFGDFVMDVLTGGGLGDLFRRLILENEHPTIKNSLLIKLGGRRLVYNPFKSKKSKKDILNKKISLAEDEEGFI
ncbi:cell wall biosynthesis protein [Methanosphaera sp. WGK6]|uniref:cell wall biosynthesis protein n=1 Tax=Methanosphaera sp. WGK6 TaxID=1561964 RepID=UPI00084C7A54|nr:cell wall biosynthesis protein [Methanosphaera sp. WGK6]OED30510.1 cell wall biosynthesis protein [Methanosphaera sp. WGK6]